VLGLLTVLRVAVTAHLDNAMDRVVEERRRTAAERDAFNQFANRVAGMEPTAPPVGAPVGYGRPTQEGGTLFEARCPAVDMLATVQTAYQETVMAIEHLETEYDESLPVHMAAEYGDDMAAAVTDGDILTPLLQATLVMAAQQAASQRETLCGALDE
jgi:hypothetical protein